MSTPATKTGGQVDSSGAGIDGMELDNVNLMSDDDANAPIAEVDDDGQVGEEMDLNLSDVNLDLNGGDVVDGDNDNENEAEEVGRDDDDAENADTQSLGDGEGAGDGEEEGEVGAEELETSGIVALLDQEEGDEEGGDVSINPFDDQEDDGEIGAHAAETQALNFDLNQDEAEGDAEDKSADPFSTTEQEQSICTADFDMELSLDLETSRSGVNPLSTTVEGEEANEEITDSTDADAEAEPAIVTGDNDETHVLQDQETQALGLGNDAEDGDIQEAETIISVPAISAAEDGAKPEDAGAGTTDTSVSDSTATAVASTSTRAATETVTLGDDDDDDIQEIPTEPKPSASTTGGGDTTKDKDKGSDDEENSMPMIRMNSSIFESQPDEDEDEDEEGGLNDSSMDPDLIQNMMEFQMAVEEGDGQGSSDANILQGILKKKDEPSRRILPRRAAAQAAANTIKEITSLELREQADNDADYDGSGDGSRITISSVMGSGGSRDGDLHRCHHCKKMGSSLIVVRQYGTDVHLCSNSCFNLFRNPDPTKRPLPCAKCGNLNRDKENATVMYWETMNFCSDACVGNFQLEIGSECSTCVKRVAWQSLGKYCVRFGSDIRQFCSAGCLESYKKNARVCFHCQLDIKGLRNMVLATIPNKALPKEFCSQDCVEMHSETNVQHYRPRPQKSLRCSVCSMVKLIEKELVVPPTTFHVCSERCYQSLLKSQNIGKATKCETCPKFLNMEYIEPAFYVATDKKAYGFCSAVCKNVFVLKQRQILSCTNCKVKKYNYDLIQSVTGTLVNFAVCSLHCLPKPSGHILTLKDQLNPSSASELFLHRPDSSGPIINSVTSRSVSSHLNHNGYTEDSPIQISSVSSLADSSGLELTNGTFRFNDTSQQLTLRQMSEDDIIEIRDEDIISIRGPHENGVDDNSRDTVDVAVGRPSMTDRTWLSSDVCIIVGKAPPKMRNKATSARPLLITRETQTEVEMLQELWPRPDMKVVVTLDEVTGEKIQYVPVLMPYPVYLPFPIYALDKPFPVPMPFPVGIPVPIPLPVGLEPQKVEVTRAVEVKGTPTTTVESVSASAETAETVSEAVAAPTTTTEAEVGVDLPTGAAGIVEEEAMDVDEAS